MKKRNRIFAMLLCLVLALTLAAGCAREPEKNAKQAYNRARIEGYEGTLLTWLDSLTDESLVDTEHGWDALSAFRKHLDGRGTVYDSEKKGLLNTWLESLIGMPKDEEGSDATVKEIYFYHEFTGCMTEYGFRVVYTDSHTREMGNPISSLTEYLTRRYIGSGGGWSGVDMDGEDIVILSHVQEINKGSFQAEKDGNVINDAVYNRNEAIVKRLNCTIIVKETVGDTSLPTVYDELNKLKDTFTYNLVATAIPQMVASMNAGLFHDLANKSRIDLNKDYYDKGYNEAFNAGGRQYLVTGKITPSWYRYQLVTFFNRNLFRAKNIDYPYQLVLDGNDAVGGWTVAKMMEIAADLYEDHGNGQYDADDTYGYCLYAGQDSIQTDGFMSAFGLRLVEKDEDGYYKMIDGVDASPWGQPIGSLLLLLGNEKIYTDNSIGNRGIMEKFIQGTAAMVNYPLYAVESADMISFGKAAEGYGILPLPKANDEQTEYGSYVQDEVLAFGIPNSLVDPTELLYTTHFLETFASESYNTTMPSYYEKALTKRFVTDILSHEMIKIVDRCIYVDPADVYASFGFQSTTLRPVYDGSASLSDLISEHVLSGQFEENVTKQSDRMKNIDAQLKLIEEKYGLVEI